MNHVWLQGQNSELVQIFNTQAGDVTAYDGCFPKPKQFYFADKHPQKISITTKSIRVSILVSFIFRLVARHRQREVQIQGKMRLTQIKESQTKKMVQESKKSVFRAQHNSRWVIDGSSMSNQLHQ